MLRMRRAWLILGMLGCGGTSGEPLEGDIAIDYGGRIPDLVVGAAVQDESDEEGMLVQIGSDKVDCDTYLDRFFDFNIPNGTFVYFTVDKESGSYPQTLVGAMRSTSSSVTVNVAPGSVTIDAIEPRVTGSVSFNVNDDEIGTISVSGTFDVVRCF
jgi:hypothetical protein